MDSGQSGQNAAYHVGMGVWQVQAAKQRFSEVLREAERGEPQFITRHGKEVAVILNIEEYRSTRAPRRDFKEFLERMPLGDDIDLLELIGPRESESARDPFAEWGDQDPQ